LGQSTTSSSRTTSGFLPRRLVNSVADVERLDHCRGARRQTSTRRATGEATMCKASIGSTWPATVGFCATCVHLHLSRAAAIVGQQAWRSSYQAGMRGPIYKMLMEEAASGAARLR